MLDKEILEQLVKDVAELKATVDDIAKAITIDRKGTTDSIVDIYKRIGDATNKITTLYDIAIPLELEIFPEIGKARLKLNEMFEKPEPEDDEQSD